MTFDPQGLLGVGLALVAFSTFHSALLGWGQRGEHGLNHVLAAAVLQGLGILSYLARPEDSAGGLSPLLVLGAGYGLWALRRYAGLPARMDRWGWTALGAWVAVGIAFQAMGFSWVPSLVAPAVLAVLALAHSRELWRLPREGEFQLPARICSMLAMAMAMAALGAGLTSAFIPVEGGAYGPQTRAWFWIGILAAQQGSTLLLAQVQGQRIRRRLDRLAATDPVTGLASAQGFRDHLDRAVDSSLRNGKTTSLLVLDLDDFAALSEQHGPAPMAHVQEAFATFLNRTLREADLTGRLGPGRFAALLHQTQPLDALLAAERLRGGWENVQLTLGSRAFRPSLSGGVASTREPIEGSGELLVLAMARAASVRAAGGNSLEGETAREAESPILDRP